MGMGNVWDMRVKGEERLENTPRSWAPRNKGPPVGLGLGEGNGWAIWVKREERLEKTPSS